MKIIPSFIQSRIAHRPNLVKIADNIGWLFFDRLLRLGVGLLVGIWVARYLGPAQFGQLNYAIAFVSLFGAVAALGLNEIVVRDIVRDPASANATLGTAFVLQLLGGLIAVVLIVSTISFLRPEDILTKTMVAILGFALVFKSSDVIKYWFESQVDSRCTVWVENSVFLLMAGIKVALILNQAPLVAFVWIVLADAAFVTLGLFGVYLRQEKGLREWSVRLERAKGLLKDSWPLILSGIAIIFYIRIDQIMLGQMLNTQAVGIYSSATRITELFYMAPIILSQTLFPAILQYKNLNEDVFREKIQALLDLTLKLSVVIGVVVFFSSYQIVHLLYGGQYDGASEILKLHIWMCIFVFMGVVGSRWYLAENLQHLSMHRSIVGAVVNIIMNLILIPVYGAIGAAIGTLTAVFFSDYLFDCFSNRTRVLFWMKTRSFCFNRTRL